MTEQKLQLKSKIIFVIWTIFSLLVVGFFAFLVVGGYLSRDAVPQSPSGDDQGAFVGNAIFKALQPIFIGVLLILLPQVAGALGLFFLKRWARYVTLLYGSIWVLLFLMGVANAGNVFSVYLLIQIVLLAIPSYLLYFLMQLRIKLLFQGDTQSQHESD